MEYLTADGKWFDAQQLGERERAGFNDQIVAQKTDEPAEVLEERWITFPDGRHVNFGDGGSSTRGGFSQGNHYVKHTDKAGNVQHHGPFDKETARRTAQSFKDKGDKAEVVQNFLGGGTKIGRDEFKDSNAGKISSSNSVRNFVGGGTHI
jgi:hypothetical protein